MIKNSSNALRRADRALMGAFVLMLVTAGAAAAYSPFTDKMADAPEPVAVLMPAVAAVAVPTARPVLADTVRVIAAPTAAQVAAVARVVSDTQTQCLADAMYYEARGEGVVGEKAVAEVVYNRVHSRLFPRTICGVVYEGAHLSTGCQFSFTCDGEMHSAKSHEDWIRARVLAAAIVSGVIKLGDETDGAIAYHATYVDPDWGSNLVRTVRIGNHVFYRLVGRHWDTRGA
jgi:spore germination cell wall hydrolase CwlJ-like protein